MKFNLATKSEADKAFHYLTQLAGKESLVEVRKISTVRTLNQNSYLHLLLGYFGQHFGYTLDEAKTVYKRDINPDIYVYEKQGAKFLQSSADLTKEEMTITIDRLREQSKRNGCPLPAATDQAWLREISNEIERSERTLRGGVPM